MLLILSDDHAGWCMGCAGNPVVKTPNMDHLAREGVFFSEAVTTCPACCAFASLFHQVADGVQQRPPVEGFGKHTSHPVLPPQGFRALGVETGVGSHREEDDTRKLHTDEPGEVRSGHGWYVEVEDHEIDFRGASKKIKSCFAVGHGQDPLPGATQKPT
jgi:hypothetical protein